jgi:hypothetical protein
MPTTLGANVWAGTGGAMSSLDIQDFLDAAGDASKRSRTATVVLVVASVLMFAGLLNSLQNHWMLKRLVATHATDSKYLAGKVPLQPEQEAQFRELFRGDFRQAMVKSYVENAFTIRVPFFGVSFDVNDLGIFGGFSLMTILLLLRYALSREVENVRLGFDEAEKLGQRLDFYKLLAMRQVFTVPPAPGVRIGRLTTLAPKAVCVLPLLACVAVGWHDLDTREIARMLGDGGDGRYLFVLLGEAVITCAVGFLTVSVIHQLVHLDGLWVAQWTEVKPLWDGDETSQDG